MTKAYSGRRLRIPVRLVDGKWELLFGGQVPVKETAVAELVVDRRSISDEKFLEKMEWRENYKVLDEGTPLLVGLNARSNGAPPDNLRKFLLEFNKVPGGIALEASDSGTFFVKVWLYGPNDKQKSSLRTESGGLWVITHGFDAIGLASTTIRLPADILPNPVASLNHAYTRLSELFEPRRISHTGNIYKHVLYQEKSGKWYPLELLRNGVLAEKEQEIAQALWGAFLAKMTAARQSPAK